MVLQLASGDPQCQAKRLPEWNMREILYSRSLIFLTAQHTGSRIGSEIGAGGGCEWEWLSWLFISPRSVSCCVVVLLFEMLCVVLSASSIANTAGPSVWYSFLYISSLGMWIWPPSCTLPWHTTNTTAQNKWKTHEIWIVSRLPYVFIDFLSLRRLWTLGPQSGEALYGCQRCFVWLV